ncbi:MAG: 1-acyl-sn-glycerol-3-phosphate acyltransferase, partial [Gammaproteobacteria bacterium]|nr:1-acyl-sn-glycerol-3-phosphate acyltransferase [Gammaproteobacteria bacterium]
MLHSRPLNRIARKLLHLWVSARVLPKPIGDLQLDPQIPVVYVVETRSWSNLLVLQQQCERFRLPPPLQRIHGEQALELQRWHSIYTIAPRQAVRGWLKNQPKRSRMLRGIVEVLRENPTQKLQFVPVSIFWGRPVAMQKNWLQILFADSWAPVNRLKKLLTIAIHGRETLVKFSDLVCLQAGDFGDSTDDEIIDRLQQTFSRRLRENRVETLGPDISHSRTLVRKLIMNPAVQNAIGRRSAEEGRSEYKIALQAHRYLDEIVASCSQITIRLMQLGLTAFWNRFYSGIKLYHQDTLRNLSASHEIIYVPCHRSHIDYLLLSYVIYYQGLAIPYIAAGKNLNMPIIGRILRGGGAFFIRRSFKGNELYSTVLFEYLASLMAQGVPIEYFVEGGRSRTGRLLQPKPGMLSMSARGFLKYRKKPLAFVPVYIGYEKLM